MSEILQQWLAKRIALVTDSTLDSISHLAKDGRIFGDLLYNYNIISFEQRSQIIPTDNEDEALKNLQNYVAAWLRNIGINCSQDLLFDISKGKTTAAIKLLYQMYLVLQDKDLLYFTNEQLRRGELCSQDSRFIVTRVPDEGPPLPKIEPNVLAQPLIEHDYTIQWHKSRLENLKEKCRLTREKYRKYLEEKFAQPPKELTTEACATVSDDKIPTVPLQFPVKLHQTYEELMEEERNVKDTPLVGVDQKKARRKFKDIVGKNRHKSEEKAKRLRDQKVLLLEMWEKIIADQQQEFDEEVSKKFLKQSEYEKQMTTKMLETRLQKEIMMEHRKTVENEIEKEKEYESFNALIARESRATNQKDNYYCELERKMELHKRLYAEKLRLKAERIYNMCLECVKDIVSVAFKNSEFKEQFLMEVPRRVRDNWKQLFVKGEPIFEALEQPEDLVQGCLEELPENMEEVYSLEMARQNAMDEVDFESYLAYRWPFDLERLGLVDEAKQRAIDLGLNILSHIIHRLLLTKYPKPEKPKPPELPSVIVAACVNGLSDESVLPQLQKLLNFKGIRVITLDAAINYCLKAYKDETKEEYDDEPAEEEKVTSTKKDKKKGGVEAKGKKKTAKKKETNRVIESDYTLNVTVSAIIQTPKIFPGDEVKLSKAAEIGKQLQEYASLGEILPDDLVARAFVEYLRSMMEIKGWALINFPFNMKQAACLEEALTARRFPLPFSEDENQLEDIIEVNKCQRSDCDCVGDCRVHQRKSRILPINLAESTDDEVLYVTRLSAFINVKQATDNLAEELAELPPLNEILEPSADPLERFYTDQGCNYTFYYRIFDTATIKHLAKLIIGEFTIPPKTSIELFGHSYLYPEKDTEEFSPLKKEQSKASKRIGEKKTKVKNVGKEKVVLSSLSPNEGEEKGKKGKDKKQAIVRITLEDKETQIPEVEEEIVEVFFGKEAEPQPGEQRWVYVDLPLSNQFQIILATFWENTEDVYITDLKQLFFVRRTLLDGVIPYVSYVKRHMVEFIGRPDDKFQYIAEFQRAYNAIDADMRDDDEVKAELHCRVSEFREKLWTICDVRREECENERRRLISDNWVSVQANQLINNAITMLQIELDRFVETMQLLSDYYLAAITYKPLDVAFNKTTLHLLKSTSATDPTEQVNTKLTTAVEYMLTNCDAKVTGSPFHETLQKAHNEACAFTHEIYTASVEAIKKATAALAPAKDNKKPAKGKKVEEPDPLVRKKSETIFAEWKVALDGELERVSLQLSLLRAVGEKDLEDVFNCGAEAFHGIFRDIEKRYNGEIESIEAACLVFASAIEAEVPLQPQMILEGDRFYVQPDVVLFPDELPPAEPLKTEFVEEGLFKICQLDKILGVLQDLAPSGLIIGRKFTFLLQDWITLDAEDGKESVVPTLYKQLTPKQVELFLKQLFGNTELIDWRDFIIYHLHIPFPTEEDLLDTRSELRQYDPDNTEVVKDYQFFTAKLWFETCSTEQEQKHIVEIKNLLFKMYRINEDTMNYTPMLLAFCKDDNVVLGVAKALELSLGRYVCWNITLGEACVEAVISQRLQDEEARQQHDIKREENFKAATAIIDDIIDHTVHVCDSVVIEDVISGSTTKSSSNSVEVNHGIDSKWMNPDLNVYSSVSFLEDETFSEIGRDVAPYPGRVYFLPFEALMTVITAAFSWHATVQNLLDESLRQHLEVIYESCRNDLFNGSVLVHEFLNNEHFLRVIQVNFKFVAKEPVKIIKELLAE